MGNVHRFIKFEGTLNDGNAKTRAKQKRAALESQRNLNNGVEASAKRWDRLTSEAQVNKPEPLPKERVTPTSPVAQLHADPLPKLNGISFVAKVFNAHSLRGVYQGCADANLVGERVNVKIFKPDTFMESENVGRLIAIGMLGNDKLDLTLNIGQENKTISLKLPEDTRKWIEISQV